MSATAWYHWEGADLVLRLKLQPRASRDGFAGTQQDRMRVRITAPPVDGRANQHLCKWLAREFDVARSAVVIEAGFASPIKRVRIQAPARLPVSVTYAEA